jgi:hypothetical protein
MQADVTRHPRGLLKGHTSGRHICTMRRVRSQC